MTGRLRTLDLELMSRDFHGLTAQRLPHHRVPIWDR
jgi:hypothetical protein